MRRFAVTTLAIAECAVLCAILTCSFELSQQLRTDAAVGRVTHAVVATSRRLAFRVQISIRRRSA